ncbi:MAG: S8 family serine peptidase [bacterium]|nr:S8 family serine peptidase [bacterium]
MLFSGICKPSVLRAKPPGVLLTLLLVLAGVLSGAAVVRADLSPALAEQLRRSGRVDPSLIEYLHANEAAEIMVVYRAEFPPALRKLDRETRGSARRAEVARGRGRLLSRLAARDFSLRRHFAGVPAVAGVANVAGVVTLANDPNVRRVGLDTRFEVQLAEAVPLVGLAALHAAGHEGAGIQVATIDTGVDSVHADLVDSLIDEQCFCTGGCCPSGGDSESGPGAAADDHGHGTRVAGVLTSNGSSAPLGGANGAQLVAVKTMNSGGGGTLSDILAGLDWLLVNRPDIDVVNMSIGGGLYPGDCDDVDAGTMAFAAAIDPLWLNGVIVVAGSGNGGASAAMMAPACLSNTVSVGAVWDSDVGSQAVHGCTDAVTQADQITCFSNSSSTTDVVAPGAPTTSSRAGGGSSTSHGTSYAAPLVSACAAVLLELYPLATPDEIAAALTTSATSVVDAKNGLDYPRLDCPTAAASLASAAVPSFSPASGVLLLTALLAVALSRL